MTKNESITLFKDLNKLGGLKGVKFAYGVSRNLVLLKQEIEVLEKASALSKEYEEFEKKRIALAESFSKKDEKGKAKLKDGAYDIEEGKEEEMEAAFQELIKENQAAYDARVKQVEEYNELLKTESDVSLHKISINEVPNEISVAQLHSIRAIIDEAVPSPYQEKK